MSKNLTLAFATLVFFSCSKTDDKILVKGSDQATAIYNQAYQENFEADEIADILTNAMDAYVLIDPFLEGVTQSIASIKANGNEVGAYISVGTGETYRDDYTAMKPYLVSKPWGQWPDEYFVNSTEKALSDLMKARIDQIASWGCDWVEFDNMDWVYDDDLKATYGFQVTQAQGIAYYQDLCNYVHTKGMKCMAKNMVENAAHFDGVLYESYHNEKNWWNQTGAQSFLDAGKLVIVNHYNEAKCNEAYEEYISIYNSDLSFICEDCKKKKYVHFNQ